MKNCLAVVPLEGAGIEICRGILNFFSEIRGEPYRIRLCEPGRNLTAKVISGSSYDGFIIPVTGTPAVMNALVKTRKPLVLVNITDMHLSAKPKNTVSLWIDQHDIGRLGAEHYISQGFHKSFGFVQLQDSTGDLFYSSERESAFRSTLAEKGFSSTSFPEKQGNYSDAALRAWLARLPKPTAIMAVNDQTAVRVLNCCKTLGLSVPELVSVLGVDDITSLTEGAGRSLSSIRPDFAELGYVAAQELIRMLSRKQPTLFKEIVLPVNDLVARKSTAPHKSRYKTVKLALDYIKRHSSEALTPEAVAGVLGKSRRLLDMRFSESIHMPISQAIGAARLKLCKDLLSNPRETIAHVAATLGFRDVAHLRRYFKRHSGMSISQFCNLRVQQFQ